jgi:MSHA biogenesis protein MshO
MRSVGCQRGFTLVELIMVIVIIGIIGGMVSVFMKSPIDAYIASGRRAAMTDVADTVVRRMARDIQRALPNSIRTSVDLHCLEFIPTKTGGRYRADDTAAGLSFATADGSFNMLGNNNILPADQQIGRGDWIVVYNLGIPGSEAYDESSNNRAQVLATAPVPLTTSSAPVETTIPIVDKLFPLASGSNRFHVVPSGENVVSYVCSSGNLHRTASTFTFAAGHSCPATGPIVASNVNCASTTFNYSGSDLQRNALVSMVLAIKDSSDESVTLQHEVHVSNTP